MKLKIYDDNTFSIGNTPIVRLQRVIGTKATILAKIEARNPLFSVKDRIGAAMIWDAEKRGILKKGMEIVEATSGNTGIALAFVGAARGYKVTFTMPESMTIERRRILHALGARVILTEAAKGMRGAVEKAEELVKHAPKHYFMPQQFKNPANPAIHEKTTGPEIWEATGGKFDVFVAGIGTGGTITGVARYLKKKKNKKIMIVGVEPARSPVITQHLSGKPLQPGSHMIQGIGAGFIPDILELSLIDRIECVTDEEAIEYARRLALEEGISCGISSGAAVAVAVRLAKMSEFEGKNKRFVVILPDLGERYLSTTLFD